MHPSHAYLIAFLCIVRPHVGPVQSHARLCRTRTDPDPIGIHGHQAHLRHSSEPLHPHRDGPDCLNRRTKKDTAFPHDDWRAR